MIELLSPLDQYQAFVDENGRVTPEWYSWLVEIGRKMAELEARIVALEPPPPP